MSWRRAELAKRAREAWEKEVGERGVVAGNNLEECSS